MGKKSSSKKQRRLAEQNVEPKKPFFASIADAWRRVWARIQPEMREIAFTIGLTVIGLITSVCVILIGWRHLTAPKSISLFLPESTVAMVEVNSDFRDPQWEPLNTYLLEYINVLNATFQVNFAQDIYPWLARRAGVALMDDMKPAIFFEVKDEKQAFAFFENRQLQVSQGTRESLQEVEHRGVIMHEYAKSSPFTFFKIGRYLVVAGDEKTAKNIIDASHDRKGSLYGQQVFQRVKGGMSGEGIAFAYGKPGSILGLIPDGENTENEEKELLAGIFSGEGIQIKTSKKQILTIEHAGVIYRDVYDRAMQQVTKKYDASLAEFFSSQTTLFVGGGSLTRTMALLGETKGVAVAELLGIFKGDRSTTLENREAIVNNLIALAKHEYALGLDHDALKIVIRVDEKMPREDLQKTEQRIKQLVHALQAIPALQQQTVSWKMLGSVAMITSTPQELDTTIARWANESSLDSENSQSLKETDSYARLVEPHMDVADDIIYLKPKMISSLLPAGLGVLSSISEMSMSSAFTEGVMKTVALIVLPEVSPSAQVNP